MKRLIIVEIHKLLKYKTFWIFFAGYALLFFLAAFVFSSIANNFPANQSGITAPQILTFPYAWHTFSWLGGWFYLLLGLLIILLLTNEFECNTLRQHIIDGFSREQFLTGRYILIGLFSLYASVVVFLVSLYFGTVPEESQLLSKYTFIFLGTFFLQGFGFLSFALLVSFFIKRAMLATFVFICFPVIIEPVIGLILNTRLWDGISEKLPFTILFSYIPTPQFIMSKVLVLPSPEILLTGLFYVGIMMILTWFKFKFSDL